MSSIARTSGSSLAFTATAGGATVGLGPFHDAQGFNYAVYWNTGTAGSSDAVYKLVNAASGLVLGVRDMSAADGGAAVVWGDTGTADHQWVQISDGSAVRWRNVNSGKVLGVENMATTDNARVLQWADNGTADHRWILVANSDGTYRLRNVNSGKVLAVLGASTAWGTQVVQESDNGSADNNWRLVRVA